MSLRSVVLTGAMVALASFVPLGAQKLAKDPETGKIRKANAEEAAALERMAKGGERESLEAKEQPREILLPRGGYKVRLGAENMNYAIARKDAGGKVVVDCVRGETSAKKAVRKVEVTTVRTIPRTREVQ